MRYRGIKVPNKTYRKIRTIMHAELGVISHILRIPLKELKCHDIERYFGTYKNYLYVGYSFSDKLTKFLAGDLRIIDGNVVVGYNSNPIIAIERQNFTKMHETTHSIVHIDSNSNSQSFSEILDLNGYSDEEKILEIEADFGASICMINDKALYFQIMERKSFYDICYSFDISSTALKLRIKNFLFYNYDCSEYAAEQFTMDYIYNKGASIYNFIKNK